MSQEQVLEFAGKCPIALEAACKHMGWKWLGLKEHRVYVRRIHGYGMEIPGFDYTVVVDAITGKLRIDEDDVRRTPSNQKKLDKFRVAYYEAVAGATCEAANATMTRTVLADGSIELDIHVGGGIVASGQEPPSIGGTSAPTL